MTRLHFNYKDIFRSLRLGFSAKKIWMMFMGLLIGFAGYAGLTYLAYLVAGYDLLTVWEASRLLPFPDALLYPFPWYAWVIYAVGGLFFVCTSLVAGTAVSKVTYEQLRGDEFYEAREAYKFALRHVSSVLASPLLLIGFVALVVVGGLILGLLGMIPYFGELLTGLMALPAFAASMFIVYLLVVLFFSLLLAPSVVGATKNDTFDTIFEVFSCVNEQPGRLVWYLATVAVLAKFGSFLLGMAASAAGRIGYAVLKLLMGGRMVDLMSNASFYFKVTLPHWCPEPVRMLLLGCADTMGLHQVYTPAAYVSINWSNDVGAVLLGVCFYVVALLVCAFGCSVWYSGTTLTYSVLAKKKDDKNVLELPEDEAELLEPVVAPEGMKPGEPDADSPTEKPPEPEAKQS